MLGMTNKLGVLGSVVSVAMNLSCCAPQVLGPVAAIFSVGGFLDRVSVAWQMPLLYGSLAAALVGFGLGWKRHRRMAPLLFFLPGAVLLLYPLHESLEVSILKILVWLGFGLLFVAAAWDTWLSFRARRCWPTPRSEASP